MASGEVHKKMLEIKSEEESFNFEVEESVVDIQFDPEIWLLFDGSEIKKK